MPSLRLLAPIGFGLADLNKTAQKKN